MSRTEIIKTVNILVFALLILYFVFGWKWCAVTGMLLMFGNIINSRITDGIAHCWIKFSHIIGRINSVVILTLVYYIFVTPLAVLYRLVNKDISDKFFKKDSKTMFHDVKHTYSKETFEKMW